MTEIRATISGQPVTVVRMATSPVFLRAEIKQPIQAKFQTTPSVSAGLVVDQSKTVVLSLLRGPQGPQGPSGGGSSPVITANSGEAISANKCVRIDNAGNVFVFDPNAIPAGVFAGIAKTSTTGAGQSMEVIVAGLATIDGQTFTPGTRLFVGASGTIASASASASLIPIGQAVSSNQIVIDRTIQVVL